jgi:hypothetical protein
MDGFLVASVISLVASTALQATSDPQKSIIFFTLYRTEEFGIVFSTLLFLGRKKPTKVASSEDSTVPFSNTISSMPSGGESTVQ